MPSLFDLEAHDSLDARLFHLAVRRLADSLNYGSDHSPFLGSGTEYVQSRPYQPGDPIKCIDWRVTARTDRVHVKEYEAPRRMPLYILLDTSASMCVSSQRMSKYGWATQIAGGVALAALNRASPVGILGCGERDLDVRPSLSRSRIFQWLYTLRHFRVNEQTTLSKRMRDFDAVTDCRSLVLVISDLHDAGMLEAMKPLAQRHECIVVELKDPAERGRLAGGLFRAEEAETGHAFTAHPWSRFGVENSHAAEIRSSGIDHLVLWTHQPIIAPLRDFFRRRGFLGKGTR